MMGVGQFHVVDGTHQIIAATVQWGSLTLDSW